MARWVAIVALLLGMGFTAFESFSASTDREAPVTIMDGHTPWPPDKLADDGTKVGGTTDAPAPALGQ